MAADDTGPARYIRTEINFGDGPKQLNYALDTDPYTGARSERPITPALVRACFEATRDAALEKLEQDRVARLLSAALGRVPTADEVALTRIGRGPLDNEDGEVADGWLLKQGAA